jgi:hypothetical protein
MTDENSRSGFLAIGDVSSSARSHDLDGEPPPEAGVRAISQWVKLIGNASKKNPA